MQGERERRTAGGHERRTVAKLAALRGISNLGAMALITEIGDFRRFKTPRELMSFIGLVPREHSSGGSVRRGGITKTGNSLVRRVLIDAAWHHRHRPVFGPEARRHLRGQPPETVEYVKKAQTRLCKRYARLVGRGKKPQIAVVAVARELCGFVWGLMTATA